MIERQELYCHDCGNYVQFDLDMSLNGNHVLHCPKCNHHKKKLSINPEKNQFQCWVCSWGGKSVYWAVRTRPQGAGERLLWVALAKRICYRIHRIFCKFI